MSLDSASRTTGSSETGAPLLSVRDLRKYFDLSEGMLDRLLGEQRQVKAVDGVDLDLFAGETLAVVGESGCGKSTLGKTILNLHRPTGGEVRYEGDDVAALSDAEMQPYRRELQMIFQDPLASLNPRQTVGEIVTAPMEVHGIGASDEERLERTERLLERVGLSAAYVDRYPHQFSGGQQQRIGIARALALEPSIIVADEPVSALDVSVQAQILNLLRELRDELGLTLLFITHDLSVVRYIADRVAVMYLGEIVELAPVDELFDDPRHPYTKSLLSAVPRIDPGKRVDRTPLQGTVPSPIDPPSGCRFHTRCPEVIPPEGWEGTQEAFKSAFDFRTTVLADDIQVDDVELRLELEGRDTDQETVADQLVAELLSVDLEKLPDDDASAIERAALALATGDRERAESIVSEAFSSPCVDRVPSKTSYGRGHEASCHRLDSTIDARPAAGERE